MQQLYLYILIASLTIASPGPGVLLTLTNTLNYNLRNAMAGIIGVAVGMGVISIIAASSVGVIITTSQLTLLIVKGVGAAYLIYLGVKLFRSVPRALNQPLSSSDITMPSASQRFRQGVLVSLFNPKPIVFFMALFPQAAALYSAVQRAVDNLLYSGGCHSFTLRPFRTQRKNENVVRKCLR